MATHSSILAWGVPWTEEPGGLQSTRSQSRKCDNSDSQVTAMVSVSQFSRSVVSDSLRPHESQHARSPCLITNSRSLLKLNVHRVSDTIQPSHPLSSPSPPAPNPFQHQGLFQQVSSLHEVAKVLEFQLQHQYEHPGLISFRMD